MQKVNEGNMNSLDWDVLNRAVQWLDEGYKVHLFTVLHTWGSSPRLPGAVLVVREAIALS